MRTEEITRSAARLQHSLDALNHDFQSGLGGPTLHSIVLELRLAIVAHADVVTELVQTARGILGNLEEARVLPPLLDTMFQITQEIRAEFEGRRGAPTTHSVCALGVIVDELLAAERRLMCRVGTILFPAETW